MFWRSGEGALTWLVLSIFGLKEVMNKGEGVVFFADLEIFVKI